MNKLFKRLVVSATLAATVIASAGTASADDWVYRRHHHHGGGGDALAAGVAGLAVGALIGGALAAPPRRHYVDDYSVLEGPVDEPTYVYRTNRVVVRPSYVERRVYVENLGMRPWTRSWMRYCSQRYRSFDPSTGTFIGYDGREHFCR